MVTNKIIRSICLFKESISDDDIIRVNSLAEKLKDSGFEVQTKRICSPNIYKLLELDRNNADRGIIFGVGTLSKEQIAESTSRLLTANNVSFNYDLTNKKIDSKDINFLFDIIQKNAQKTFNFAYVFNNLASSPFFPSSNYQRDGFSIGLQPTDLSDNCKTVNEWFKKMKQTWEEIIEIFKDENDFLGIDSSIAPLFEGKSSLINFIKRLGYNFVESTTSDIYIQITNFIKQNNPKPIGLCGLMLPCLEDFELADEYQKGNFPIERNLFISLQSGLGIDTYPIGIDEKTERVLDILKLIQKLSIKHKKSLSARFVSDGKTKIGQKSNFNNQYLKDVIIRKI